MPIPFGYTRGTPGDPTERIAYLKEAIEANEDAYTSAVARAAYPNAGEVENLAVRDQERLQKEADARRAPGPTRAGVRPDTTVTLGADPSPGAAGGPATANSVSYSPPIPPAYVSPTETLHIRGVRLLTGWTRGVGSASPPPPVGTGSLLDGGLGDFRGLIR